MQVYKDRESPFHSGTKIGPGKNSAPVYYAPGAGAGVRYAFAPEGPGALAEALIAAYNGFDDQQDAEKQDEAGISFFKRQREFGEAYQTIIKRAAGHQLYYL